MFAIMTDGGTILADTAQKRFVAWCRIFAKLNTLDEVPQILMGMEPGQLRELLRNDEAVPPALATKYGWKEGITYSEIMTQTLVSATWAFICGEKIGESSPYQSKSDGLSDKDKDYLKRLHVRADDLSEDEFLRELESESGAAVGSVPSAASRFSAG